MRIRDILTEQGMAEGSEQKYLWHGSRQKIDMLEPRQSVDTGGAAGSNQNAIYATSDPKVAIAIGLTTPGSDTGMFPNDPQMVLFKGNIRKGENVYLHKVPFNGPNGKPQFVQGGNSREFHTIPGVKGIKPVEIKVVPVDKYLNLIRQATPADLVLQKKYMRQGVAEGTIDIGSEWMSDTELDQYVPDQLEQEWRELVGYDMEGRPHPLWANMTGGYEPDVNDPQDRANMVKVANKWFAMKRIPGVRFLDVRDADDELEWLVQIGEQGAITENLDQDERVLNHFTEVVADEMGYDPDEVLDNVVDELTTPSGIQVYSFSDDDLTYLMGVLGADRPSALVTVSHAGGGQDNELEIGIGDTVRYAVSYGQGAPELTALADQASYQGDLPVAARRVIARGGPGQDEWNMVGIALDMLWGRMQHRYESVSEGSHTTEKQILTRIRQIMHDRKLSGTDSNAGELSRLKQKLKDIRNKQGVSEGAEQQLSIQQLATISDEALDRAYGYGRSTPGNTFGWQANLMSAAYAKKIIDAGETDIERIADAIHRGWNVTAKKFVANPDQFSDTAQLRQAGKLDAKLQQRAKLMRINYAELPDQEQEKDRVVARALLQALQG